MVAGALKTRVTKPEGEIAKEISEFPSSELVTQNDVRGHEEGDPGWSVQDARDRSVGLKTQGELEGESERENEVTI